MAQLPIRQLTLWKQGIGYFQRRGTIDERTVSLVVPRAATNDVLKSLNIVVHQGEQVLSVDYETPEDKNEVLKNLAVRLAGQSSLVDLLVSLRGSRVTLALDNDQTPTGRLVGVEASLTDQPPVVVLQGDEPHQLQIFPVTQLQGVTLLDDRAANDVSFFLDVSQVEQTRTTLTIRLATGEHDLEVGYLAPSPVWRVSYRLARTGDNQATLTAWGIFENSLDEDLEEVALTLISGRPISFVYDLYETHVPGRPEVSDDATAAQLSSDPRVAEALSTISHDLRAPLGGIVNAADLLKMEGDVTAEQRQLIDLIASNGRRMYELMDDLLKFMRLRDDGSGHSQDALASFYRSGPLGDLKVSGRYFVPVMMSNAEARYMTYMVDQPISVRRGQSAMVPIISATVDYQPLCVYNGDKMPNHPLLVWDLQNTTGFALEQGPVTLIDDGYMGEGLLRFAGVDDNIQIPHALEFGVLVVETTETHHPELYQLEFDADQQRARISNSQISETTYTLSSRVEHDITVLIERRDPNRGSYYQMPEATFSAAGHTRWQVVVPAKGTAEFVARVRSITTQTAVIAKWSAARIDEVYSAGLLDDRRYGLLQDLLAEQQREYVAAEGIQTLRAEQGRIQTLQEQLRKNLGALGTSDREVTIRNQILTDLENSENRRREIDTRVLDLEAEIGESQDRQTEIVSTVYAEA